MPKVKLAEWCDRWKHGNLGDKDFFSIASGEEKDASEEIIALSMGRLVKAEVASCLATGVGLSSAKYKWNGDTSRSGL